MNKFLTISKQINMFTVAIILTFFYIIAFGLARFLYVTFFQKRQNKNSYWNSHIEKPEEINYASAY